MKIGISGHSLSRRRTGVEVYLDQLLRHLPAEEGDHVRVFSNAAPDPWRRPGVVFEASPVPTRSAAAKVLWEQCCLPVLLRRRGLRVAHAPLFVIPSVSHARWIVTVHDLTFFQFPGMAVGWRARYQRLLVPASVRKAARVITDSHAVRQDLVRLLGIPEAKIAVIPLGVDAEFFRRRAAAETDAVCRRLGVMPPFLLAVGTLEPRKNLPLLLRAFHHAGAARALRPRLVLAGRAGWGAAAVDAEIERLGLADCVTRLGYVAAEDLPALYSAAEAFLLPSLYEGFGLPALEAMACETPVLCSDRGALPEVVADAGWLLDPTDESAWTETLSRLLAPSSRRAVGAELRELGARGRSRALRFSWQETARQTRRVYEEVGA